MENAAEFFYEKLKNSTSPGVVLTQFYADLLDRSGGRSEIILFNRLIKIFGRFTVFFAVMNLTSITSLGETFPYGLIYKICKDNLEKKYAEDMSSVASKDLTKDIVQMQKTIDKTVEVSVDEATYKELE